MRVGLIADIHGNLAALDAVLAELAREELDRIVCLGDVAATGPQPTEVLRRLRLLECPTVMGNADAFLLHPVVEVAADEATRRWEEMDRWCAAQLGPGDLAFVRTFRQSVELTLDNGSTLLCVHGSPRSFNDVISATTPDIELAQMLTGPRARVLAGGHWHFQLLRRYEDMLLVNPGSVGLVYDIAADGAVTVPARAEFALLTSEGERLSVEFRRIPYDRDATVRAMFERGMPHAKWWAARWR